MKRQGLVVVAVLAAAGIAAAVFLLGNRHGGGEREGGGLEGRALVDDSLGVRLRLPESSGWVLRRERRGVDGRVVSAVHEKGRAIVHIYALPCTPDEDLGDVFRRRQEAIAAVFGVKDLNQVVANVMRDSVKDVDGKPIRQWQALTRTIEVPGEKPSNVVFMWLLAKRPEQSIECIGMVRFPAQRTPEEQAEGDARLRDVSYILQSFQVR